MSEEPEADLPRATHTVTQDFLGYKLTMHVLDTGQRVFEDNAELRRMLSEMGVELPATPKPEGDDHATQ